MARSANQKLKLLYLRQFLLEHSDENHPVTVADMIRHLAVHDISAERKSIYDDLESLRLFGMDIIQTKTRNTGYYVGQRDFELAELKLLVDSVQSSKFITHKKTLSLIGKIEGLASSHDGRQLQRQVYVRSRVKSMNESVYYNVDEISAAINGDRRIRFRYFEYTVSKERRFRHNGAYYEVSPFALIWDDENYYLLAWDDAAGKLKHYRVDKMAEISATDAPREGGEAFAAVDMSAYTTKVFGMFTGRTESVSLRFENHLIGAVLDRLGQDAFVVPDGPDCFTVRAEVVVSPQFFAWVAGFGSEARILGPETVLEEMRRHIAGIAALYAEEM